MQRNDPDRVLWILTDRGGSISKGELARRLHIKMDELDIILRDLEHTGKINLTKAKGKLVVELRRG